nr:microtubule-associated serine/threonine-protein kinase 2-like isoform X2 [Chelonoidis abingdonii]
MKKGRSRGDKAGTPPPPRRESGRAAAAERRAAPAGGGRREPQDARAPGVAYRETKEKDVVTESAPLRCRKLSNPDIFSSTGKTKLHRQLSQDDCKLRRGSLASSLSGANVSTWPLSTPSQRLVQIRRQKNELGMTCLPSSCSSPALIGPS